MSNPPKSTTSTGDSHDKPEATGHGAVGDDSPEAAPNILSDFPRIHTFWKRTKQVSGLVGPTAFIIGTVIAVMAWMDFDIGRKLSDPQILRKIAAESRPSLIFDAKESIVSDMGAAQYVKDIRITDRAKFEEVFAPNLPKRIHIEFARPMQSPPVVTALYEMVDFKAERGRLSSWDFTASWKGTPQNTNAEALLFRLEIIP